MAITYQGCTLWDIIRKTESPWGYDIDTISVHYTEENGDERMTKFANHKDYRYYTDYDWLVDAVNVQNSNYRIVQ